MNGMCPRWLVDIPIAHRGLHDASIQVPENSLPAFEAAATLGLPIELDVRVSRDGVAVVLHDLNLSRMTGVDAAVDAVDGDDLRRLRLDRTEHHLPLLVDVLEAVDARVPLLLDVKNEAEAGAVEEATLSALAGYDGDVVVQSFNPLTLQWFARNAAEISRGLLSGDFRDIDMNATLKDKLRRLELVDLAKPQFIGYDVRCLPFAPVTALRERGFPVLGWTVTSEAMEAECRRYCDNVIFEGYLPKG